MNDGEKNVSDKAKAIAAEWKRRTAVPAYGIRILGDKKPDLFDSKFGGAPYWDMSREYPKDADGKPMMLLAQINFTRETVVKEPLPTKGMLQIFIIDDDLYGADFDNPTKQTGFRVIYHEEIDESVTLEQVETLGMPKSTDEGIEYSPILKELAVVLQEETSCLGAETIGFDKLFAQIVMDLYGENVGSDSAYSYFSSDDYDYFYKEVAQEKHRMLGYPYFTQYDPRDEDSEYDTLLLQMDSEMRQGEEYILWGDVGVANFFINKEKLKNKDFSDVWYNWDCG